MDPRNRLARWKAGKSIQDIAAEDGVSKQAVSKQLRRFPEYRVGDPFRRRYRSALARHVLQLRRIQAALRCPHCGRQLRRKAS